MILTRLVKIIGGVLSMSLLFLQINSCKIKEDDPQPTEEGIFINELLAAGSGDDWVELYNSLDQAKDLTGYAIYDDATKKYTLPSGTTIPAKGYLVLNCNDIASGLNTNFKLSSTGEVVYLDNAFGILIDKIQFPELQDGQSYGRYPDGTSVWMISGLTTKGATNGTNSVPAIKSVDRTPLVPALTDAVTIKAELSNSLGVTAVKLYYRFNSGSFTTVTMTQSGAVYTSTIPAANATGKMDYYVEVTGANSKASVSPENAPTKTYSYLLNTDALPKLYINEFMAANTTCCPDKSSGVDEFDDWIEIYNAGTTAVNIGGMYLSDNKANPFKHKIPTDNPTATTIQPGGFLVLWADGTSSQGPLHLDFNLSAAGEDVAIFYIDGRAIDAYTFGAQTDNVSWGRTTDGAATWKSFSTPTQGKSNN